jgi:hypothetical protein
VECCFFILRMNCFFHIVSYNVCSVSIFNTCHALLRLCFQ